MRVIVVGSGIAGLVAAIRAARQHEVLLVTKGALEEGSTRLAQGGIAAALAEADADAHVADTLAAGAGLCDPEAVRVLCEEGPQRVRDLIAFGVEFDRDPSGALARGLEAAHSAPRILHAGGDATGAAIEAALAAAVRARAVDIVERAMLIDLVLDDRTPDLPGTPTPHPPLREMQVPRTPGARIRSSIPPILDAAPAFLAERAAQPPSIVAGAPEDSAATSAGGTVPPPSRRVVGVELLVEGARRIERADAVILATGGAGQLYAHTTNPTVATGDGIAAAWRAGAEVADLEFVQFHPTVLADGFLVSEAVRGEGAVLRDAAGRRYMPAVDPRAELAPRDIVARETARVMARQHGAPALLDATAVPLDLPARFPSIHAHLRSLGIDWSRDAVPVTPAAHYTMGGIATDLLGRTSLPGLLAVGEAARTGVHGANRLASNSLLEGLVFAWRAAEALAPAAGLAPAAATGAAGVLTAADPPHGPRDPRTADLREMQASRIEPTVGAARGTASDAETPALLAGTRTATRAEIQALAWRDLGLVRDGAALAAAVTTLAGWRIEGSTVHDLENRNLLDLARLVAQAALVRTGSVGAHHRSDDRATTAASA